MKKIHLLLFACTLCSFPSFAQLTVNKLLTENRSNPVGLDVTVPRFSWQLVSNARGVMQTAYEIKVREGKTVVWNSGKVQNDSSVHVTYKGGPLAGSRKYNWQVRVWDNKGKTSPWSGPAFFQMALVSHNDWKAKWIGPGYKEDPVMSASPLLRKEFTSDKKVVSAVAYITAYGFYEAQLNGQKIGDAYLTPGWTSYEKRLQYQAYDVTKLVKNGANALGVMLGNGWYRSNVGFSSLPERRKRNIALLLQLTINYADGTSQTVISDNSWKSTSSEIRDNDVFNGEIVDARLVKPGWALPGYNDHDWSGVTMAQFPYQNLIATYNEPVKKHETFKPVKIITTPAGEKVIDFGQNLVGRVILKVKGQKGDSITISHAEVLDKAGNFYTVNLREARAQSRYILSGNGEEIFEPRFTWYGFRYIKVEGYPGELRPGNFEAVTLYSDMPVTGAFATDQPLINQLQHNIQWGQKGNFLDVPTDCPQRNERLGWTGDAQVFSRTATFNMNVNNFFAKWLKDVEADQVEGRVPFVVPNVMGGSDNSAGWADCATIIPWNMYLAYGDSRILADQYNSMKAYVESIRKASRNDLWNTGFHFGDWLFYRPDDDNDGRAAVTDKYLIAQCFYAHSTQLLINAARVLGKKEDETAYTALLQKVKEAFVKEYLTPSGRLVSSTQTAYVLALQFDMLPEALRTQAATRLKENVQSYGHHLTTGFLGTPYLCDVLSRFGYDEEAYRLLQQESYPSWLYPVKMGATTIWERWDGIKPNGSFQTPSMNSFNHYAYGAIGDWMYRTMVGIDTDEEGVGYKRIKVQPHIGGKFNSAAASLDTYYGTLSNSWKIDTVANKITMEVKIPNNTTATICIPATEAEGITESGKALSAVGDLKVSGVQNGYVIVQAGAGNYHFVFPKK